MLEVIDVTRSFGGVHALDGAALSIRQGLLTGIIGPNGAGKTTLFNCIAGLVRVTSGDIKLEGQSIKGLSPEQITNRGLIKTFQLARGFPRMTVLESLMLYGTNQPGEMLLHAIGRSNASKGREVELLEKATAIAERLKLAPVLNNKSDSLSGGQKKLLEIGRALMAEPKLMLLDEPMAGVNPSLVREIGDRLREIVDEGITIVLIEHQMDLIARLCDHVIVMAEGRKLAEGTFDFVANSHAVQDAYMGRRDDRS
jgi:ABC-type branched-subunit amino acid transport system ATPase component